LPRDKDTIARELLALRCRRGDRGAFEELIREWEPRFLYFIRRIVRDEADAFDVLQAAWMKILNGIGALNDERRLAPWLYRIARNTALSYIRSREPSHKSLEDHSAAIASDPADGQLEFADAEQVHRGLLSLSLPHREVLTLYFLEEMTIEEVASVFGVPPGTVKSRLHYAKRALRKVITEEVFRRE
jgi:RNA polymerase sigma-70 factor (ECF subfamily)